MKRNILVLTLMAAVLIATAPFADAQDNSDEWQFNLAPLYLWAPSIGGTMTVRGQLENEIQVDFGDAVKNLQMAFTIHFEARKGRFSLFADASYLDFGGTQYINTPGETADIDVKNLMVEGGGGYEVADQLWLIAGVRYFELDAEVGFQVAPSLKPSDSWIDLFAGLAWRPEINDRWTFSGRFDVGAGGSDLVWNAAALFDVKIGSWASILFGYRHLDYDYSNNDTGLVYDVSISGPVAAIRFFW